MKKQFKFVALDTPGEDQEFDTFAEAFKPMYEWVDRNVRQGSTSRQVLETAIWIEDTELLGRLGGPIFFYDARDRAINEGILVDGKLVEQVTS